MAAATKARAELPRRTQEARREATTRKILDAATDALIDVGYAEASVHEICQRADVSTGGLFRHYRSREELMVAVGEDVGRQILEQYRRRFEAMRGDRESMELALVLVRDACRSRLNQAWYELFMAARTNARLRKALAPLAERYFADIRALGHELLPEIAAKLGPVFDVLVDSIIAIFDGEAVHRFVFKRPAFEAERLELLVGVTRLFAAAR